MRKQIFSLTLDPEIIEKIDKAACTNGITRSEVARIILEVIRYVPVDKFRMTSPILDFFGVSKEVSNGDK